MNDGGDCRTAPITQGLLKTKRKQLKYLLYINASCVEKIFQECKFVKIQTNSLAKGISSIFLLNSVFPIIP